MTDLQPITALGKTASADQYFGALRICENPDMGLASLALRRDARLPALMGLELPGPGKWAFGQNLAAFWIGPGQWMIEADGRASDDLAAILAIEAPGCSVTEQTDAWSVFEIVSNDGAKPIHALMEKLVNLDVTTFTPGHATRTDMHHMSVYLIRRAENRLAVLGMRSISNAVWHGLTNCAVELYMLSR